MKMKLFALVVASLLLANPATGATLSPSFDYPEIAASFDTAGFSFTQTLNQFPAASGSTAINPGVFTDVPVPAAAWLFMSGLVGLIGISRRKKPRETRHA
ncbi:MAG: PEP-CTERM sorting domain-containing protein [Gammaproteobacteria bacterium]|nr:PEP-CTERM sorting domain-containing protein [Gammaproteobacteria bacterium]MCW9004659.1 PEP-CTERM sorting domain-containing protein [Gammaproteobacteria bacterium]